MKGRYLLFAVCLGCIAFHGAMADDADTARAATRRASGNTTSGAQSRQPATASTNTAVRPQAATSRINAATTKSSAAAASPRTIGARGTVVPTSNRGSTESVSSRTATSPRTGTVVNVSARPAANTAGTTAPRTAIRTATPARTTTAPRTAVTGKAATSARGRSAQSATAARAATTVPELRDAVMGRDYKTCRQVYYECMDEFCANKDSQLKRCACSSRLHEFDRVKQSLTNVEDKLLDFNQRLLTVNMDKEDAAALFTATEGENAYNQTKDTSDSKKILNEISKKLNANGNDSFNQGLSAISLSLNADAAFDNVDSLLGASTTSKEGVALYNAALPVCREMAAEVCDEEALAIAASGYQMMIEQDCNTVAKSYETQTDQAREKVREGSALLDISRLDIHQKRNSDDILTCKKKMLTQLSETSVCGENLDKCLDMSGRYIDPATGQAFLTDELINLSTLITRPEGNQTWTGAPGNDRFVSYLNSKKKYLEPAMENCQDIADYVWDEFIEDALAQIKLAQDAKLEEVRQSCTTLTTQCLADTAKSIEDFDARALSTFGVKADKTVNDMCASVQNACSALLKTTGTTNQEDDDWIGGMTQIATNKTYETIMQTCREVGRACIIQACKSISGNFGMCENIENSINRKSIINRTACWPEVKACVREAGEDAINRIFDSKTNPNLNVDTGTNAFYKELYGRFEITNWQAESSTAICYQTKLGTDENAANNIHGECIYDICANEKDCDCQLQDGKVECNKQDSIDCRVCRLAEKIWGNCEAAPTANIYPSGSHNQIRIPTADDTGTLLAWFAKNTNTGFGTEHYKESCRDTSCPSGKRPIPSSDVPYIVCADSNRWDSLGKYCDNKDNLITTVAPETQCCSPADSTKLNNLCCNAKNLQQTQKNGDYFGDDFQQITTCTNKESTAVLSFSNSGKQYTLVCVGGTLTGENQEVKCDGGKFVYVTTDGYHVDPHQTDSYMSYTTSSGTTCTYINAWSDGCAAPDGWMLKAVE